mmetsp:Transcript_99058/g.248362  ORF Transcript_99058/g.248362 Transcript_99058/m.248362 type:complete len:696 (+) Transcript_99058:147-2234(+)
MSMLAAEQPPAQQQQEQQHQQQQQQLLLEEGLQGLQAGFEADLSVDSANPLALIGKVGIDDIEDDSGVGITRAAQTHRPETPTRRGLMANDLLPGLTDLPLRRSLFGDGSKAAEQDAPMVFSNFTVPLVSSEAKGNFKGNEERSTHIDSGMGFLSDFCESTPSVIDGYMEQVDSSTEAASEPGTTRQGEASSTCGPTPKPDRPAPDQSSPSAPAILIPEPFESIVSNDLASAMQFGVIGAEALETLERVQDAECWYKLNKQLNNMGNSDAKDLQDWQIKGSSNSKLLDARMSEFDKANDDDVWASLHRQINSLNKEVAGIAKRHGNPEEEEEEIEGARRLQGQIMSNDLHGKIARLEVDVQEMVGEGCNVQERNLSLAEQLESLEDHVGNVVTMTANFSGEKVPFEPKQVAPCDAAPQLLDMEQQILNRARLPMLAPKVEEAEQQEFIEPSRAAKTLQEQAAISRALATNKPGSGVHSLISQRSSTASLGQHLQVGPMMPQHQQVAIMPATPRGGSFAGSSTSMLLSGLNSNASSVRMVSPLRAAPVQSQGAVTARGVSPVRQQVLRRGSQAVEQPTTARGVSPVRHQQLHQSAASPAWVVAPTGPASLSGSVPGMSPVAQVRAAAPLGPHGTLPMSFAGSAAGFGSAPGSCTPRAAPGHAFGSYPARPSAVGLPAATAGVLHTAGLSLKPTISL